MCVCVCVCVCVCMCVSTLVLIIRQAKRMRRIIFSSTACLQVQYLFTFSQTVLRNTVDAPRYIVNAELHSGLQTEMVTNDIGKFANQREERLLHHVNVEAIQLLNSSELVRRIKRKKPFELTF